MARQQRLVVECEHCGLGFRAFASRILDGKSRYCSNACRWAHNRSVSYRAKKCVQCGRKYKIRQSRAEKSRFCSKQCLADSRKIPRHIAKLHARVRTRLRTSLSRGRGGAHTFDVLGYSREELAAHLERQFLRGMTWSNMGEWHIDHIVPLAAFEITGVDAAFRRCWALANLRPLWAIDNERKQATRSHLC